ncbi:proteoglycan 4-like [Macrosteles quadrilineatus]|uniref:proteoglycan 4-like n=1 Tax=Macrosteles quadrilineatus TaxID=74068 RepID=UPI0023E14718|nr:proteoglycan 4-like [Macrosteles quadrilineatus]
MKIYLAMTIIICLAGKVTAHGEPSNGNTDVNANHNSVVGSAAVSSPPQQFTPHPWRLDLTSASQWLTSQTPSGWNSQGKTGSPQLGFPQWNWNKPQPASTTDDKKTDSTASSPTNTPKQEGSPDKPPSSAPGDDDNKSKSSPPVSLPQPEHVTIPPTTGPTPGPRIPKIPISAWAKLGRGTQAPEPRPIPGTNEVHPSASSVDKSSPAMILPHVPPPMSTIPGLPNAGRYWNKNPLLPSIASGADNKDSKSSPAPSLPQPAITPPESASGADQKTPPIPSSVVGFDKPENDEDEVPISSAKDEVNHPTVSAATNAPKEESSPTPPSLNTAADRKIDSTDSSASIAHGQESAAPGQESAAPELESAAPKQESSAPPKTHTSKTDQKTGPITSSVASFKNPKTNQDEVLPSTAGDRQNGLTESSATNKPEQESYPNGPNSETDQKTGPKTSTVESSNKPENNQDVKPSSTSGVKESDSTNEPDPDCIPDVPTSETDQKNVDKPNNTQDKNPPKEKLTEGVHKELQATEEELPTPPKTKKRFRCMPAEKGEKKQWRIVRFFKRKTEKPKHNN